jgi:hypothetical protein
MGKIQSVANGGFYLLQGVGGLVELAGYNVPQPVALKRYDTETDIKVMTEKKIKPWGLNNLLPKEIKNDISCNSLLKRALKVRIDAHYGKGVKLFKETVEGEKHILQAVQDDAVTDFFRASQLAKFQYGIISDFELFRNIFLVIVTDATRKKIVRIYRSPAMFSRWSELNSKGKINTMYAGDWYAKSIDLKKMEDFPVLDIDDPLTDLRNRKSGTHFVLPIKSEEFDNVYYDQTFWDPIRKTWLPVACAIPEIKMAIMKNQMLIKYHVKIPYAWIQMMSEQRQLTTPEEKTKFVDELMEDIQKYLSDTKNYGKTFTSFYGVDPQNPSKELNEWKIEVLDNKLKHEDHLPDAKAANQEIMAAVGLDYTLLGGTLPGGSEAGSGSNKREAYLILQSLLAPDREFTTMWFDFVRDYNGWDKYYTIKNIFNETQTLDKNPTGIKTTV